jgi:hypothetical protein
MHIYIYRKKETLSRLIYLNLQSHFRLIDAFTSTSHNNSFSIKITIRRRKETIDLLLLVMLDK